MLLVDADLLTVLRAVVAVLLVDVDFLAELRLRLLRAAGVVFENTYVLFVGFAALGRLDVSREGFLMFRVTFPPCLWWLYFYVYLRQVSAVLASCFAVVTDLDLLLLLDSVLAGVPVAGREDTERDGNCAVSDVVHQLVSCRHRSPLASKSSVPESSRHFFIPSAKG
ncbi:hypothetical protein CC80DRAFT_209737 [Byssothecium circinans]|uniref:Uncharacterized protein n=1 Tax=Byssothecium circinans TaxID=147558 RepID=A0A6A5TGN1_9PLEO|nr:hypothetical protein CC80DRAFT_209737 [Byssothecium circinans]